MREQAAPRSLISPVLDHVLAVALVLLSLIWFLYTDDNYLNQSIQTYIGDSADYRYLAEHFWGVPHRLEQYDPAFTNNWGHYLNNVPFRGLAFGTLYLALSGVVGVFSLSAAQDPFFMGLAVSCALKVFFALSYITLYWVCQKRYGTELGLICLAALLLPFSRWELTQSTYGGEPIIRGCFVLMAALTIKMMGRPQMRYVAAFMLLWLICGHVKTQWSFFALCMIPAFTGIFYYYRLSLKQWGLMVLLAVLCPLSVLGANAYGWGYATLSPGAALHANVKTEGQFLKDICANQKPMFEMFCDSSNYRNVWWRIYTGPKANAENFQALDRAGTGRALHKPMEVLGAILAMLPYDSVFPDFDDLPALMVNAFVWLMLIMGCFHPRTWVAASLGLGLWLVPAVGNAFAAFSLRYFQVMSGVHLALALAIMMEWIHMFLPRLFKPKDTVQTTRKAVLLLSGGLDSTTVLAIAKARGFEVYAMSFDYGQRHRHELDAARRIAAEYGAAEHRIATIDLAVFGGSALTQENIEVPKDRAEGEIAHGIPVTYVPARNTIFLSFALAWAEVLGAYDIFIGVNALDYSGYPDCRPEFIAAYENMANKATAYTLKGKRKITIHTPLISMSKAQIIEKGLSLGVDYALTISCYDPAPDGTPCGHCDACQLRNKGFRENGMGDPVLDKARKSR